jgi:hypothetical protein
VTGGEPPGGLTEAVWQLLGDYGRLIDSRQAAA